MFHCPQKKTPGQKSTRIPPRSVRHSVDVPFDAFLFKAAKLPGPPSPTGGPPTAGAAGAAGVQKRRMAVVKKGGWV